MLNDKLNKREEDVMNAVFTLAGGKQQYLVSPKEILDSLPPKSNMTEESLLEVLKSLEIDGYFELTLSDRKGERMYVIRLLPLGMGFKRADAQRKRTLLFRLGVTVVLAIVSFVIGLILKGIFS